jgi:hypothetical protein
MVTYERADRPAWHVLVALAGAATAIVIAVYLIGGAIVWERLHVLGLPANQAVAPLPRNLLLIDGVRALAWPVTLGLVAAGLVSLLANAFRFGLRVTRATWAVLLVVWIVGLAVMLVRLLGHSKLLPHFSTWQKFGFLAALGLLVAVAVVSAHRQVVAVRSAALGAALAMASVAVVIEAVDVYRLPVRMEYAQVRLINPAITAKGFYIGATSDTVYLAPNGRLPNRHCHVRGRILALPRIRVKSLDVFTSTEAWPNKAPEARGKCESPR